jgi:hypothetical protein
MLLVAKMIQWRRPFLEKMTTKKYYDRHFLNKLPDCGQSNLNFFQKINSM